MKTLHYPLVVFVFGVLLALAGCSLQEAGSEENGPTSGGSPQDPAQGLQKLACFECHAYGDFTSGFPHDLHIEMVGIHCTQCHAMKPHKDISLNDKLCGSCHDVGVVKLQTSSMPVVFNHRGHTAMFGCGECHSRKGFPLMPEGQGMTMEDMYQGRYCGKCHDGKTAFASTTCNRCHADM